MGLRQLEVCAHGASGHPLLFRLLHTKATKATSLSLFLSSFSPPPPPPPHTATLTLLQHDETRSKRSRERTARR